MAFKIHYGDFPALLVLLEKSQRVRFKKAVESGFRSGGTDALVYESLTSAALSENERVVFRFAYAILRGWGPGLLPHTFWGLDRRVLERVLAAIARAVDAEGAADILLKAAQLCQQAVETEKKPRSVAPPARSREV